MRPLNTIRTACKPNVPQFSDETNRSGVYDPAMEPCDRLKKIRINAGFENPIDAARRFGWSEHTYKSHENGIRGIRPNVAKKYAEAFNVNPGWLLTGESPPQRQEVTPVSTIPVYGDAAGGVWLENADGVAEYGVMVSPDPRFSLSSQYARRVQGDSVSNRIQSGEYALIVRLDKYPGGPRLGELVDVERVRAGLREHTIKVFKGTFLETDSAQMTEQEALPLSEGEDDTDVRIVGIVVGATRQF